jgi:selenocysteine-specific translation elongation factor
MIQPVSLTLYKVTIELSGFDQNLFPEMNEQFMTALRDVSGMITLLNDIVQGSLAKFVASSLNEGLLLILQDMENFEVIPGHLSLSERMPENERDDVEQICHSWSHPPSSTAS